MLVFNGIILFLKAITIFNTLIVCFIFYKKGGDNILVTILIAPFFGSVIIIGLMVIMFIVNTVYLFTRKVKG